MKEDIQNCSQTVMFRGTPCTLSLTAILFLRFEGRTEDKNTL